jgi:acyl phosphate:glycerol-3-phosphate acyltransferase
MFMSLIIVLLGYLIGAIPTAYIFGRFSIGQDIRQVGDANMGAANAYRVLGARIGIAVYFIDAVKGALPVIIARWFDLSQSYVFITGVATVVGHNWPVFLGFRGGRGESTTIGILYVVNTIPALVMTIPTVLTLIITKNVIVTSAFLFIILPVVSWMLGVPSAIIAYGLVLPIMVAITHYLRIRKPARTKSEL